MGFYEAQAGTSEPAVSSLATSVADKLLQHGCSSCAIFLVRNPADMHDNRAFLTHCSLKVLS